MTVLPSCANCSSALTGPFCASCGQKASDLQKPFWWLAGEFLDAVFSYDSRTFRTVWLLLALPGAFTQRYLAGQRSSMLPPFRLFLISSVLFFLALQATGLSLMVVRPAPSGTDGQPSVEVDFLVPSAEAHGPGLDPVQRRSIEDTRKQIRKQASATDAETSPDEAAFILRLVNGFERLLEDPTRLNGPLNVWLPRLMLVLVPVLALLLAAVHLWPGRYYIEHLVFALHLHTVIFVALAVVTVLAGLAGGSAMAWAVWPILAVYVVMAMQTVYGRSWWLTAVKFTGLLMLYSCVLVIGMVGVFVVALTEI